jgi:hypothetical protein
VKAANDDCREAENNQSTSALPDSHIPILHRCKNTVNGRLEFMLVG